MLKKMIFVLVGFTFFFTIFWVAIGYDKYGTELIYHHLNLQGMIVKVKDSWYGYNIYDDIKNIKGLTNFFSDWTPLGFASRVYVAIYGVDISWLTTNDILKFFIEFINIMINPINAVLYVISLVGYGTYSITMILVTCASVIVEILEFLFNPMFI